jgi:hypothetical protein
MPGTALPDPRAQTLRGTFVRCDLDFSGFARPNLLERE